ncbi:sulfurtransferase TusA family protein [Thiomicrospira sp. WB1]|uniref:sulfurtransferase TusA family protein n=1 Tax=Thiomicrospira sp. WB1 TaxID=1685380 RepID=UPI00074909F3|nr:sulfurtransferase TusA family protein [Thiomicrospira sp. WB1]KUJ71424.1 hypothetical protein AVO41_07800 [Thiomicrospira sp. WB1]
MEHVDVSGLPCPMPLLKLKQAMARSPEEAQFELWSTDPGSCRDIPAFCAQQGMTCEELVTEQEELYAFRVCRQG